jgi:chromosome segregation ATPase
MSNLIDELAAAEDALSRAEARATEASRNLRECKSAERECRQELRTIVKELKTQQSRYPLLERITPNGQCEPLKATHDEHQRGPTAFPESVVAITPPATKAAAGARRKAK